MTRAATLPKPSPKTKPAPAKPAKKRETTRDVIEQIVVAFILAFLIRGFEAEAFVIPTGSMAPTLYGQHKEVTCPQCGEVFAVNAADEAEGRGAFVNPSRPGRPADHPPGSIRPPARTADTGSRTWRRPPRSRGDRILVMKFLYNLPAWLGGQFPARWDVVVFHFPEEPETNYIKRLIGLPGEVVRLFHGDIFTRKLGSDDPFQVARKPLAQQQAMMQLVWDDARRPKAFADLPEWNQRWRARAGSDFAPTKADEGTYRAAGAGWSELGYNHRVPEPRQWDAALTGKPIPGTPRATLITDYYGYNSGSNDNERPETAAWFGPHWVGDLAMTMQVKAASGKEGEVRFDLVEAGVVHRCQIDLSTGDAILSRGGKPIGELTKTPLRDDGKMHEVKFANVDDRLTLWVDGETPFGDGIPFETSADSPSGPTAEDLEPARVGVKGGEVAVSGLVLKRDIYYTQKPGGSDYSEAEVPWVRQRDDSDRAFTATFDVLSDPEKFGPLGNLEHHDFEVRPHRYMMMGDNSPRSSDGRAWNQNDSSGYFDQRRGVRVEPWAKADARLRWEVPEALVIGKAFFIYWPHGVPLWPSVPISRDFLFPFRPYVERMRWIR